MTPKAIRDLANRPWEEAPRPPNVDCDLTPECPDGYHRYPMWWRDCFGSRRFWIPALETWGETPKP